MATSIFASRKRLLLCATTMAIMVLAASNVAAAAAVTTTKTVVCPSGPDGISFDSSALPSCTIVSTCSSFFTSCVSGAGGSANITCSNLQLCYEEYYFCIVGGAELAKNSTGDTCSTWGASISTDLLSYVSSGGSFNGTKTYSACSAYACTLYNATVGTRCTPTYSAACPAISIAPTGGPPATPVPSNQPAVVVQATISLAGDFSVIFTNATAKKQVTLSLQADLSNQLGYPVIIISIVEGSLVVNFQAAVAASNTAAQAQLVQSVSTLSAAPTTWLASTQTAFTSAGGSGTLTAPTVVTMAVSSVPASPPAPVQDFCGSGCIAGVVVGVVAAAVIVTGIAYVFAQKHAAAAAASAAAAVSHEPAAAGAAASSTEPVEMASSAPAAV